MIQYWLVKSEPSAYGWADFERDRTTAWTGVRNFAARKHLRAMRRDDVVLFYESGEGKWVRGVGRVTREAYADPSAAEGDWSAVDLEAGRALARPVTLAQIKGTPDLADMVLLRQGRLSVAPVTRAEYEKILALGGG